MAKTYVEVECLGTLTSFHAPVNHEFEPYQIYNSAFDKFKSTINKYYPNEDMI